MPVFRGLVEAWFDHAGIVARDLTRIFELALGLREGYFAAFQTHSVDILRMNHYGMPPGAARVEKDQMGMGAHTDFGIVTVLWADPVTPGLQILDRCGGWHDVVPAPGALLVNLGDLLARWKVGGRAAPLHLTVCINGRQHSVHRGWNSMPVAREAARWMPL